MRGWEGAGGHETASRFSSQPMWWIGVTGSEGLTSDYLPLRSIIALGQGVLAGGGDN